LADADGGNRVAAQGHLGTEATMVLHRPHNTSVQLAA
jgi:hypothetical protein